VKYSKLVLLSVLASTVQSLVPPSANAFLIATAAIPEMRDAFWGHHPERSTGTKVMLYGMLGLGFLLNPVVGALGTESVPTIEVDRDYLLENGYTADQADRLIAEHAQVSQALIDSQRTLLITNKDSRASLASDLRKVVPTVSESYISLLSFEYGLK